MSEKVLLAMSGGVDSAASAVLLREQGFEVGGVTLRLTDSEDRSAEEDAAQAAKKLGIPHTVIDLRDAFRQEVIRRFAEGYAAGITPNPCIDCNRLIKFGKLMEIAEKLGYDTLATGHYARRETDRVTGHPHLMRAADTHKDQTYVLYPLSSSVLSHVRFPLGSLCKADIRRIAEQSGLVSAHRKDSQDICFIPDGDYARFLIEKMNLPCPPGRFVDEKGKVLAPNAGALHYTIGQRKGLGVGFGRPVYVLRKDAENGDVVLGDETALFSNTLTANSVNWIEPIPTEPIRVTAKTRYSQKEAAATVVVLSETEVSVQFDTPQRAVTPGQSVVFYQDEICLGGGIIRSV